VTGTRVKNCQASNSSEPTMPTVVRIATTAQKIISRRRQHLLDRMAGAEARREPAARGDEKATDIMQAATTTMPSGRSLPRAIALGRACDRRRGLPKRSALGDVANLGSGAG
jgi:hypothetical protein